ncbi:hypothetical protein [Virgisporangium ochraceum]|uniref:hypothetical protein n=1 Tax=Virgisporangium ochraceum TaxID=65505 RepID=UPI001EF22474|nr:hypothetical protein [Virgisporangium ochraceum]
MWDLEQSVKLQLQAKNGSSEPFEIWGMSIVEAPNGRQRDREGIDGGDFPGSPMSPVAPSALVNGTVIFANGSLGADTLQIMLSIRVRLNGAPIESKTISVQVSR